LGGKKFGVVFGKTNDVRIKHSQRRHLDGDDIEAEIKVLAEGPLGDAFFLDHDSSRR
jgi:hypothetical protein